MWIAMSRCSKFPPTKWTPRFRRPSAGVLKEVLVEEGKTVAISTVVGRIEEGAGNGASAPAPAQPPRRRQSSARRHLRPQPQRRPWPKPPEPARVPEPVAASAGPYPIPVPEPQPAMCQPERAGPLSPLVRKMAREYGIDLQPGKRQRMPAAASPNRIWKRTCQRKARGPWRRSPRRALRRLRSPLCTRPRRRPLRSLPCPAPKRRAPASNR